MWALWENGRYAQADIGPPKSRPRQGASRHTEQYGQPGINLESERPKCRSREANARMYTSTKSDPRYYSSRHDIFLQNTYKVAELTTISELQRQNLKTNATLCYFWEKSIDYEKTFVVHFSMAFGISLDYFNIV